jgi:hypothetical protein
MKLYRSGVRARFLPALVLGFLCFIVPEPSPVTAESLFMNPVFTVEGGAGYSIGGDFHRDGNVDLVVVTAHDALAILVGRGDGTFLPEMRAAAVPGSILGAGDLNEDGALDVVYVGSSKGIGVLLGNGNGSFRTGAPVKGLGFLLDVVVAELNGDEHLDLVVADPSGRSIHLLWGNGDGTFEQPVTIGTGVRTSCVVAVDLDTDGDKDLVVCNQDRPLNVVAVLLNLGGGTLLPGPNLQVGGNSKALTLADFDGDGHPDLAVSHSPTSSRHLVSVFRGRGDGTFDSNHASRFQGLRVAHMATGDFNRDGLPDLAALGYEEVLIRPGIGDARFGSPRRVATGRDSTRLVLGDFNSDGQNDLAVNSGGSDGIFTYANNGDGTFGGAHPRRLDIDFGLTPAAADFNSDGRSDLAVPKHNRGEFVPDSVSIFLRRTNGTLKPAGSRAVGPRPTAVSAADLDGDGRIDLAVTNSHTENFPTIPPGTLSVLLGNGSGGFARAPGTPSGTGYFPLALAVDELNGDGAHDVVVANRGRYQLGGDLSVLLGDGDGTFLELPRFGTGFRPESCALGDLDRNGTQDLVVGYWGTTAARGFGEVSLYPGAGDGRFGPRTTVVRGDAISDVAISDFNADGIPDLVTADGGPGAHGYPGPASVTVFIGRGDGSFETPALFSTGPGTKSLLTGDFNGDGRLDLGVDTHWDFAIILGRGDGSFADPIRFSPGGLAVVSDMNVDGREDLTVLKYPGYSL